MKSWQRCLDGQSFCLSHSVNSLSSVRLHRQAFLPDQLQETVSSDDHHKFACRIILSTPFSPSHAISTEEKYRNVKPDQGLERCLTILGEVRSLFARTNLYHHPFELI